MLKKKIDNPRFPHRVRIVRVEEAVGLNPFDRGEKKEVVVYDGTGRAYTDTTTTGDNKVEMNKRKASIPVRFTDWKFWSGVDGSAEPNGANGPTESKSEDSLTYVPMSGDRIEVWKDMWHEEGVVKDAEPDNNRTVVYWEYLRN